MKMYSKNQNIKIQWPGDNLQGDLQQATTNKT